MDIGLLITVGIFVILAVVGYFLYRNGYKKQVFEALFYLVVEAEIKYGGSTGEIKFAAVISWIYDKFPIQLKLFFTQKQVGELIELAVKRMKDYLDKNIKANALITNV